MRAKKHTSYKRGKKKKAAACRSDACDYKRELPAGLSTKREQKQRKAVMSHFCQKVEPDLHQSGSMSPYNERDIYTCTSLFLFT